MTPAANKNSRGRANGSVFVAYGAGFHGNAVAGLLLLSRWRLKLDKHHNRGPDNVYNKTIVKNIRCRSAINNVIKIIPETNIQIGWRFFTSLFLRLK